MPSAASCPEVELLTDHLCRQLPDAERGAIERHVEGGADRRSVLGETARVLAASSDPSSAPTSPGPLPLDGASRPEHLQPLRESAVPARYRIRALLGVGGVGVVYRAHDTRLDREVTLKLVRPRQDEEPSPEEAERLLREARAVARVRHPSLITAYDAGELQGRVFIAMELMSLSEAYHAAGQTGDAVRAARRALQIRRRATDEYLVIESMGALAGRLRAAGSLPEARGQIDEALRRADTSLPAAHPIRRMVATELGAVQAAESGVPDGGPREGGS